jgi:hypothetical protein
MAPHTRFLTVPDENQSLLDTYLRAIATATPPLAKAA